MTDVLPFQSLPNSSKQPARHKDGRSQKHKGNGGEPRVSFQKDTSCGHKDRGGQAKQKNRCAPSPGLLVVGAIYSGFQSGGDVHHFHLFAFVRRQSGKELGCAENFTVFVYDSSQPVGTEGSFLLPSVAKPSDFGVPIQFSGLVNIDGSSCLDPMRVDIFEGCCDRIWKMGHLFFSQLVKVRAARVNAARLSPSEGQEPQCLIGGIWMLFTSEHFTNAVGVCAEHLNDVRKSLALLFEDVGCNSFLERQGTSFVFDFVQRDTRDRVFRTRGKTPTQICHRKIPFLAYETLDEGRNSSLVGYDGSLDETPSLCAGSANHRRSSNINYISEPKLPEPRYVHPNCELSVNNSELRAALARFGPVCVLFSPTYGAVYV